jgi:hypothetical protein
MNSLGVPISAHRTAGHTVTTPGGHENLTDWEAKDGQKRTVTEVVAERVHRSS